MVGFCGGIGLELWKLYQHPLSRIQELSNIKKALLET
jgi:hypothetical protein